MSLESTAIECKLSLWFGDHVRTSVGDEPTFLVSFTFARSVMEAEADACFNRLMLDAAAISPCPWTLRWFGVLHYAERYDGSGLSRHPHIDAVVTLEGVPGWKLRNLWAWGWSRVQDVYDADGAIDYVAKKLDPTQTPEGRFGDPGCNWFSGDMTSLNELAVRFVLTGKPATLSQLEARLRDRGIDLPLSGIAKACRRLADGPSRAAVQTGPVSWALRSADYAVDGAIAPPTTQRRPEIAQGGPSGAEAPISGRPGTVVALSSLLAVMPDIIAPRGVAGLGPRELWKRARQFGYSLTYRTFRRHLRKLHRASLVARLRARRCNLWAPVGPSDDADLEARVARALYPSASPPTC